ncbi:MAG: murein biosynthesis integral membrane protein MurJ [Nannocystaceae bacterium]|nr:murein biosynthesis integral membrane protein MurJ [Nannocystaceae bacterium]
MPDALRSSVPVSLAILGSRVLGLAREVVFAALFGAGAIADAYQVAFRIPNLLRDLFAEGALSSAFVPTFTAALQQDGRERAHVLADLVSALLLLVTGAITLAALVFAEPIVIAMTRSFAGDAAKLALAVELTRTMLPILVLVSLAAVWAGMLNAQRRFVVPALAPAWFNLVSITGGVVIFAAGLAPRAAIVAWSAATTIAGAVQAGVQLRALWRDGYRPRLRLRGAWQDPGVRRIAALIAPAVIGIAAVNLNVFINTGFAAALGDGPVAQLSYAFRLFFLPLGVFGVAIATVTTTSVSEQAAKGDRAALAQRSADGVWAAAMLTSASAVGLFVLAEPIVRLVFRWGATTTADAAAIAAVLQAYVLGLLPYALVKVHAPAFYGVDRPRIPMVASLCGVAANLAFNAATYRQLGAPGIALGTTIGAVVNVAVLRLAYGRAIAPLPTEHRTRRIAALLLANLVLAAIAWASWRGGAWLGGGEGLRGRAIDLLSLVLAAALGLLAFTAVLAALDFPGAQKLRAMPWRMWARLRRRG